MIITQWAAAVHKHLAETAAGVILQDYLLKH